MHPCFFVYILQLNYCIRPPTPSSQLHFVSRFAFSLFPSSRFLTIAMQDNKRNKLREAINEDLLLSKLFSGWFKGHPVAETFIFRLKKKEKVINDYSSNSLLMIMTQVNCLTYTDETGIPFKRIAHALESLTPSSHQTSKKSGWNMFGFLSKSNNCTEINSKEICLVKAFLSAAEKNVLTL